MAHAGNAMEDAGKLVLRLNVGILMVLHGINKMLNGIGPIVGLVQKAGLPSWFAYLVLVGEVLAPVLVVIGLWTRPAALVIAINMMFAIGLAHAKQFTAFGPSGGWALELQALFMFSAVAIAMIGGGRYAVGRRWN
jgi:putative oxidoreductase